MPKTINLSKSALKNMIHDYSVKNQSLVEIGNRHGMSKATVRKFLVKAGVRIRGKAEHHSFKTSPAVKVTNLPSSTASSNMLLDDMLALGHVTQADIDRLATPGAAPVAPTAAPTTNGISFAGMTPGQKERAGLQEVMRIVSETSRRADEIKQQSFADLWGRSGSWVSQNQAK